MNNFAVDRVEWAKRSIFSQMGNIGSEVGRTANAYNIGNTERFNSAFARAIDLFDATVEVLVSTKSRRTKEVLRARDQFSSQFYSDTPAVDPGIEKYFTQFALADRLTTQLTT
jgi:hypothetical protein